MRTDSSQETRLDRPKGRVNILERLSDRIGGRVRARTIFGEPVEKDGITVIPVARARWAFGFGGNARRKADEDHKGKGIGGGGRVKINPTGYVEVRDGRARFRPIYDPAMVTQIIVASGVVAVLVLQGVRWLNSKQKKKR